MTFPTPDTATTPSFDQIENAGLDATLRVEPDVCAAFRRRIADLERAITIIGDDLYEEAVNRDWCDEYNQFVKMVNDRLPDGVPRLRPLNRTYYITFAVEAPNSDALSGLERHIDGWLDDRDLNSCTDFEVNDND